jgi:hypothetical protein
LRPNIHQNGLEILGVKNFKNVYDGLEKVLFS